MIGDRLYIVGNVALCRDNATNYSSPMSSCRCPCHTAAGWMSVIPLKCWCSCYKSFQDSMPVSGEKMNAEINVLRETISHLERRLAEVEKWKKTAKILCDQSKKPHKCPVCEGKGSIKTEVEPKTLKFELCQPCEGKGILWG